jgi:ADP-ribose pyrophosphatase YjhB (NUDIX family)
MAADARTYPTFPIPAVGAIILDNDHVLLVQRGQAPAKGKWTLPGGVIEVGESPQDALIREIREECQLDVVIQPIVDIISKVIRDEQGKILYHYLILDYLATCPAGQSWKTMPPRPGSDVADVRWIPVKNLPEYPLTEGLAAVIAQATTMHTKRRPAPEDNHSTSA